MLAIILKWIVCSYCSIIKKLDNLSILKLLKNIFYNSAIYTTFISFKNYNDIFLIKLLKITKYNQKLVKLKPYPKNPLVIN